MGRKESNQTKQNDQNIFLRYCLTCHVIGTQTSITSMLNYCRCYNCTMPFHVPGAYNDIPFDVEVDLIPTLMS